MDLSKDFKKVEMKKKNKSTQTAIRKAIMLSDIAPVKTFTRTHKSPKNYDRSGNKKIVNKMLMDL